MRNFQEAILSKDGMTSEAALLYMRGLYLLNGGTTEDFLEMNGEDIMLMYSAYMADEARRMRDLAEVMALIAGKQLQEVY